MTLFIKRLSARDAFFLVRRNSRGFNGSATRVLHGLPHKVTVTLLIQPVTERVHVGKTEQKGDHDGNPHADGNAGELGNVVLWEEDPIQPDEGKGGRQ